MKLEGITIRANCLNCRHYNRDENAFYKMRRQGKQGNPPVFCPQQGIKDGICEKFVPQRSLVKNLIWRAKNPAND
jgi:hypothetical protein